MNIFKKYSPFINEIVEEKYKEYEPFLLKAIEFCKDHKLPYIRDGNILVIVGYTITHEQLIKMIELSKVSYCTLKNIIEKQEWIIEVDGITFIKVYRLLKDEEINTNNMILMENLHFMVLHNYCSLISRVDEYDNYPSYFGNFKKSCERSMNEIKTVGGNDNNILNEKPFILNMEILSELEYPIIGELGFNILFRDLSIANVEGVICTLIIDCDIDVFIKSLENLTDCYFSYELCNDLIMDISDSRHYAKCYNILNREKIVMKVYNTGIYELFNCISVKNADNILYVPCGITLLRYFVFELLNFKSAVKNDNNNNLQMIKELILYCTKLDEVFLKKMYTGDGTTFGTFINMKGYKKSLQFKKLPIVYFN